MEEFGKIEIKVIGRIGNDPLSPENFDIREIKVLFDVVEAMLYPNQKQVRPPITYSLEAGSVRNIFRTTLQSATMFLAAVGMVQQTGSLRGCDLPTARALQEIQKSAVKNDFRYEFGSPDEKPSLVISKDTAFQMDEDLWAEAEFYFYGKVINAGGKEKSNIHLQTKDSGVLIITTPKEMLQEREENILYKSFMVRAHGRQNIMTNEMDFSSLELLELMPYAPSFEEQYLDDLIKSATPSWKEVHDVDVWLSQIRELND